MVPRTLMLFLGAGIATAQTISFLPPVNASVAVPTHSGGGIGIVTADFNGDGKQDIAYSIAGPVPVVGVQLGNGDGTFRPVGAYLPVNPAQGNLFVGDFNGDGKPDLAFSGNSTWIYLGKGDGTFSAPIAVLGCLTTPATEVAAVADLNLDGDSDMLCGTSVLLSNGDGTFRNGGTVGTFHMEYPLLIADFNNDGIPDVLLREVSGIQLAVALGRGDGTFGPSTIIQSAALLVSPVIAGDFTGDGKLDLVGYSSGRAPIIVTVPGNGDGTFNTEIQTNISSTNYVDGSSLSAADFNKDGKPDLMAGAAILAGNGDGTFRFPVFIGPSSNPCGAAVSPSAPTPCDYGLAATAIADFNGDGLPDIAAGSISGSQLQDLEGAATSQISVLLNDSPGDGFTITGVSSANYTEPVGAGSIVSAFGVNLAPSTASSTADPLPTTLGGIRLHVRDRSHTGDTLAPLLYVSATQINYVMTSSDPYAWVAIERVGSPYVPKGMAVPIEPLAPVLYSTPNFLAAANSITVVPFGVVTAPVSTCAGSVCSSVPIDLSLGTVYLSLYGTGFDQASAAGSICSVGGASLPLTYAGPETAITGLDQANMLLPASLAGSGSVTISCTFAAGQVTGITNPVILSIK